MASSTLNLSDPRKCGESLAPYKVPVAVRPLGVGFIGFRGARWGYLKVHGT